MSKYSGSATKLRSIFGTMSAGEPSAWSASSSLSTSNRESQNGSVSSASLSLSCNRRAARRYEYRHTLKLRRAGLAGAFHDANAFFHNANRGVVMRTRRAYRSAEAAYGVAVEPLRGALEAGRVRVDRGARGASPTPVAEPAGLAALLLSAKDVWPSATSRAVPVKSR